MHLPQIVEAALEGNLPERSLTLKELGVVNPIFIGGVGPVGDEVSLGRDVGGAGHLTGWLTHVLRTGVVFAVDVVTEAGVLESVFMFGGVDVRFR